MIDPNDPELLIGYQFGHQGNGKKPTDYLPGPDGIRPGEVSGNKPTGVSVADLNHGIKQHHVIPPLAVWHAGKWFTDLSAETRESLQGAGMYNKIDTVDEHEAWVVPGEGTPGNWLIRVYIVPISVGNALDPPHPSQWTEHEKKKGDGLNVNSGYGALVQHAGTGFHSPTTHQQPKGPPAPPKPPPLPAGIKFRCAGCGHWYGSETKLGGHTTHCCPGGANWSLEDGADWVIECECCETLDEMSTCLEGFPRKPKVKAEEEPKPESDEEEPKPEEELVTALVPVAG